MDASVATEPFPLWALLPKRETTAASFLIKYPEYDGRGIKIAIFDSGVDPGAAGLQITSDGKPKVIDLMDASGAGDVDTSTVVEADKDGFIKGLTGTQLKIPNDWTNPSGKYHIGVKNIYELYPKALRERISKEYTETQWLPMHRTETAEAVRQLNEFQSSHSDASADSTEEKLIREELQSKVDFLKQLEKKFVDLGPTYDCVVFNDGSNWRAIIDTTGVGKLEDCTLLGTYSECLKYGTISDRDMLNYGLNIHNEGNLLEIASMTSAHGTHVASIATAHFPNEPEKNGVAPGAQVVSICIGDNRVAGMETGSALMRAVIKVIESKCNVINMSYGEPGHYTEGRILDLLQEVVNKYGVIFVASAGNHGPALSTVSMPPTMNSSTLIAVGAYVSPDMMTAEYSMRQKLPGMGYSWTSRGPTMNGDLGVTVCGPGGAITSVPNWTLKKAVLMNGTSMSSPNVAGCVCLLLSGLKAQSIDWSPFSVRKSLENTALKVQNYCPFTHGHGLIQVEKAFEHLTQYKDSIERDIRFHITTNNNLGVYLRQPSDVNKPSNHLFDIKPIFLNDKLIESKRKVDFEMNLSLICDAEWITCPTFLSMAYMSRFIAIKVNPQGLEAGTANFAQIKAYDVNCVEKGPVFQIPITVIKPLKIVESKVLESTHTYKPGYFRRQFIDIPFNVNSIVVRVKNCDLQESGSFVLHTLQVLPKSSHRTHELETIIGNLAAQADKSFVIQVKSGRTLELCFGKWWSSIGETQASVSVEFHGLQPSLHSITMMASECITRIDVESQLGFEEISPNVSLKTFSQPLRPVEHHLRPLASRDVIPAGRQIYEIQLTYNFQVSKSSEVTIDCPLLSSVLYESEYESQLWMIFDVNKQYMGGGDAHLWDKKRYLVRLEKGDYTVILQIRHESIGLLEKLSELPVHIEYKLSTSVSLNLYETYRNAVTDGKKFNTVLLQPNSRCPIFIASIAELPKNLPLVCGSYFSGYITYVKDENRRKVEQFGFRYVIDSEPQKKTQPKDNKDEKNGKSLPEKPLEDQFNEALNELKITWISKLKGQKSEELFDELKSTLKSDTQLLLSRIQALDSDEERVKHLKTQISLANDVLDLIKINELIASFAILKNEKKDNSNNSTNNANNNALKNLEKQKTTVLEALVKKGIAVCELIEAELKQPAEGHSTVTSTDESGVALDLSSLGGTDTKLSPTAEKFMTEADEVFSEMSKLIDPFDQKVAKFTEKHALMHRQFGRAVKLFNKLQEPKPSHEIELKTIQAFKQLNWTHLESALNRSINVRFPKNYRLF